MCAALAAEGQSEISGIEHIERGYENMVEKLEEPGRAGRRSDRTNRRRKLSVFNLVPELGIDLGTANILVYLKGKGIVLREPSVVAVNTTNKKLVAVGEEARLMIGRTPGNIVAIRPMCDGVIADYSTTQKMLEYLIAKVCGKKRCSSPR